MEERLDLLEKVCVPCHKIGPLIGEFAFLEDRLKRTLGLASTTVDALFGIDIELQAFYTGALFQVLDLISTTIFDVWAMNTIDRANLNTSCIALANTWLCNDIRHICNSS